MSAQGEIATVGLGATGQIITPLDTHGHDIDLILSSLVMATLREEIGEGEEDRIDIGFNDPALYLSSVLAVHNVKHPNLRLFNFPDQVLDDQTTDQFRDRLELNNGHGVAMIPITIQGHYSVLFVERDGVQRIRLFDSGLAHVDDQEARDARVEIDNLVGQGILEGENIDAQETILQRLFRIETTSHGSEAIFGNGGLANDIIPLNFYVLQGEQTCGYFVLAAILYVPENDLTMQQIIDQSQQGIFQVHVTQIMLERIFGDDQQIIRIDEEIDALDDDIANYTIYQQEIGGEQPIRVAIRHDIQEIHIPARDGLEAVELDQIIDLENIGQMLIDRGFQEQAQDIQQENELEGHDDEPDHDEDEHEAADHDMGADDKHGRTGDKQEEDRGEEDKSTPLKFRLLDSLASCGTSEYEQLPSKLPNIKSRDNGRYSDD